MKRFSGLALVLCLLADPGVVVAQGFGQPLTPAVVTLNKARVRTLLKMIPELAKETTQYQGQFLSGMAGPGGGDSVPTISEKDMEKVQKIYAKYGFTMEEFLGEISVLVATYFALDEKAFQKMLPSEDKPEIKSILSDPKVPEDKKAALRAQIKSTRQKQGKLREYLLTQTNDANIAILKPLLSEIRKVFKQVEKIQSASKDIKKTPSKKK